MSAPRTGAVARAVGDEAECAARARVRGRTISTKRLARRDLWRAAAAWPDEGHERPQTREDCLAGGLNAERPCPWVSCKYHVYLDVNDRNGSIKLNFPDLEVWDLPETCALDIADRGGITLEEVGEIMNLARERIRQIETRGIAKLRAAEGINVLEELAEGDL